MKFTKIKAMPEKELLSKQHEKEIELAKARYEIVKKLHQDKQRELDDLRCETIKVIRGESRLNIDLLNSLVDESQTALSEAQAVL